MTPRTPLILALTVSAFALVSCNEDTTSTDPSTDATEPALATVTTSAALAFAQVSAGNFHTCGVTTDNRAYCWGWNVFGQLGNGTSEFRRVRPTLVAGGLRFRQISAGFYYTCGVTTGDRAYCWGYNGDGALGDGTTTQRLRPAPVAGGHRFRQVSAAADHTCGVTTEDRAYCWGINTMGQLGNGTHDPSGNGRLTPVAVAGTLRFRHVSLGVYHSCGATTSDRAYCWGGDRWGEIGDGSGSGTCAFSGNQLPCRKSPALVAGGHRFRQVDAGGGEGPGEGGVGGRDGGHTCGVTTDARAFCWGDGSSGQNGNGTLSMSSSPRLVSGGHQFRSVSSGIHHACGVTTVSRAYCWGSSGIGDGSNTMRRTPSAVAGGHRFRQVSAGGVHSCGTTTGNVAYCWGGNSEGELGDGTTTSRSRPRAVVGPM
jgi:alpha-tubulin suppressor-like RCC1 family protein